jgi:CxxC-x17-CxxC domain-containing protein
MGNFNRFGGNDRSGGRDSGRRSTFGSRDGGSRLMMHPAVCDDCGKNCEVPFKPTGNREIFCSDCFEKRGGKDSLPQRNDDRSYNRFERSDRRDDRRDDRAPRNDYDRGEREMFSAVCDDCGDECQLPFKPSSSKPVYCSRCFEKRGERSGLRDNKSDRGSSEGGNSKEIGELKAQIITMNAKLEKIMFALNISTEKVETAKPVATVVKEVKAEAGELKFNGEKSKVAKKVAKKAAKKAAKKVVADVAPEVVTEAPVKKAPAKKAVAKKVSAKKAK